ncbi:hypothetical protein VNO77_09781 [Canavalia gladiata]|uniref:Uncharacterized protein n=1 Tax=Canavalia gladiata TaxID=3824 RepID=A0AAN9QX78_CANGL
MNASMDRSTNIVKLVTYSTLIYGSLSILKKRIAVVVQDPKHSRERETLEREREREKEREALLFNDGEEFPVTFTGKPILFFPFPVSNGGFAVHSSFKVELLCFCI